MRGQLFPISGQISPHFVHILSTLNDSRDWLDSQFSILKGVAADLVVYRNSVSTNKERKQCLPMCGLYWVSMVFSGKPNIYTKGKDSGWVTTCDKSVSNIRKSMSMESDGYELHGCLTSSMQREGEKSRNSKKCSTLQKCIPTHFLFDHIPFHSSSTRYIYQCCLPLRAYRTFTIGDMQRYTMRQMLHISIFAFTRELAFFFMALRFCHCPVNHVI